MSRELPTEDGFYWIISPISEIGTNNQKTYIEFWLEHSSHPAIVSVETRSGRRVLWSIGWECDEALGQEQYWWSERIEPPQIPTEEISARNERLSKARQ